MCGAGSLRAPALPSLSAAECRKEADAAENDDAAEDDADLQFLETVSDAVQKAVEERTERRQKQRKEEETAKMRAREKDKGKRKSTFLVAGSFWRRHGQRATSFIGHPDASNYTVEADVMTDGNRRMKSTVGVINHRYVIALIGNWQELEVSSNHDRIKVSVPFKWSTKTWYRLKSRVDVAKDGSGVVRAKAWPRDEEEPSSWTIEVPHKIAHTKGAPGLFGFSPQSRYSVYVDNISVYSN